MDKLLTQLKNCTIFENLPDSVIRNVIIPSGQLRHCDKGQQIFQFQETINKIGIVLEGRVNTLFIFENGSMSILDAVEKNEILGIDLMYTRTKKTPYFAEAAENSTIFFIPFELFTSETSPLKHHRLRIAEKCLVLISNDNVRKAYRLAILSQKGLRDRIMTYLIMQTTKRGSDTVTIPFSRKELASYLCVNRSALSHELSLMEEEELISYYKNSFTILKK